MFRKRTGKDISDEEFEQYDLPHISLCANYIEEYLLPNYIAFYISTGYYHNVLTESSFIQHFNSAADMFNHTILHKDDVIENVKRLMKLIYSLDVIEESPVLKVKEI